MPLHWLLAGGSAQVVAAFIGWTDGDESSTSVAALPVGTAIGDLIIVTYYTSRSMSGGGGAWTDVSFGNVKFSYRVAIAADLSTPITFSGNTPYIVGVWRGPTRVSAARSTISDSGSNSYNMPGFVKSADCLALFGVGSGQTSAVYFRIFTATNGRFDNARTRPTSGIGFGAGSTTNLNHYPDSALIPIDLDAVTDADARVYELLP